MNEQLLSTIQLIPWTIYLQLSVVAIVALVIKKLYDNIASYLMFHTNTDLGKNVRVRINNEIGTIKHYNWRYIFIQLEESGNLLVIPITRFLYQKWEICQVK